MDNALKIQGLEHTNFSEKDIVGSDIKFDTVIKLESSKPGAFCDDCVRQRGYLNPTCACCSRFPHNK